jgi:hypothetical protein
MTTRLCLLRRQGKNKDHPKDVIEDNRVTTIGIFNKQKQGFFNEDKEKVVEVAKVQNASEKNCSEGQCTDTFELKTLSVDSIDNVLSSGTSELDYHRQRRSSQSYEGIFDRFNM